MIGLAATVALHKRADIRQYILRARRRRVSRRVLEELFIHLSLVLGFPSMLDGLERLQDAWPRSKGPGKRKKVRRRNGLRPLTLIYGNQTSRLLKNLETLHPEAAGWILRDVYGKVFSRGVISLLDRELVTLSVLALQQLDRQLYSHVRGALRLGARPAVVHETVGIIERVSARRQARVREVVATVVSQRKMS